MVVEPEVKLGNKVVNLDNLSLLTVLPNCMGPIANWKNQLEVASKTGFQAVHFCPIQVSLVTWSCQFNHGQLCLTVACLLSDTLGAVSRSKDGPSHRTA